MNKGLYVILAILLLVLIYFNLGKLPFNAPELADCLVTAEERIVRGTSFSPFIEPGQTIKVLFNYYDCHKIERGDVVLFNYAGNKNPLIKIVKGIPGDKFELRKSGAGWHILINNQVVKNSKDEPYFISGNRYKMLSLYEKDYKGVIPENAYLLLSERVAGSVDSTTFGLVDKGGIIAKVDIGINK